jgi:uncharacterized protein with PIN domain
MSRKSQERRRERNHALAAKDAKNRCPYCKGPLGKVRWKEALHAREFCSQECLDAAADPVSK